MKLTVTAGKKGDLFVTCPRTGELSSTMHGCQKCEWLAIKTAEEVKCRWTQEKEDLKTGKRRYETI